jgi:regulator of protease activity HflC (stomatin/prohibitin superfamily)
MELLGLDIILLGELLIGLAIIIFVFASAIRILRPTERGLIERLGKYHKFAKQGFNMIVPLVDHLVKINVTEMMVNAEPQTIITKDKLNAQVDAQVYFKVKTDEESVKASQYNVFDYKMQIVNLARTTLRNIIGTLSLNEANSDRNRINSELMETLLKETKSWGIEVVRTELKEIDPPKDVQDTMNKVVIAENEKQAAVDFATAAETQADGLRRAAIKNAEGVKQATILTAEGNKQEAILKAQGQAEAFKLIDQSFKGNAQLLKRLDVTLGALQHNTKYVIDPKTGITNVIAEQLAGIVPIPANEEVVSEDLPKPTQEVPKEKKRYRM